MDMQTIRFGVVVLIIAVLYGSRMTKGAAKVTPDGISFGMKQMVTYSRLAALALYIGFFLYTIKTTQHPLPIWVPLLLVFVVIFGLLQLPGTIVLGPDAVTQRFWLMGTKRIGYDEVMAIQNANAGRAVRVVGDNRVVITHTQNHAAADEFKAELTRRTGKSVS